MQFAVAVVLLTILAISLKTHRDTVAASCRKVMSAYADSTIAFAVSVELASTIMLIRKNFGLGAYEFGGLTVQLVWVITILVMLPLLCFCWIDLPDKKLESRLCAVTMALILFLINFICRMVGTYSGGQVGTYVITQAEWDQIQGMCWGDHNLSMTASVIVEIFSISASLWVILSISAALVFPIKSNTKNPALTRINGLIAAMSQKEIRSVTVFTSSLVFFSVPLFWALVMLRSWQRSFAKRLHDEDGSNVWSFGQIIAVVVFLPVLGEVLQQYLERNDSATSNLKHSAPAQISSQPLKTNSV